LRVFALISHEVPDETLDLFVRREDAERVLRAAIRDEPEWVDVLRIEPIELSYGPSLN
jgi:hypothetical protein